MVIETGFVISNVKIASNIYSLTVELSKIASIAKPGQFCNIKVSENNYPLLRRPFSIADVNSTYITFIFNIVGEGTKILSLKKKGDMVNILGPLGKGFNFSSKFETAVVIGGGLGAAPFPFLIKLLDPKVRVLSFIGGRTKDDLITFGMKNMFLSTDDGSAGLKGTVLDLVNQNKNLFQADSSKIFACGPTPMLKAVKNYADKNNIECELSVENVMACGFGVCQGCPIRKSNGEGYLLVCKDGPVFNALDIEI